ncbi:unnamed protein product [Cylindrotheca closterium]|uniref:Uncharacterized protein n=1 Tax=Cylindrotheca closterium TaxID=2856 RepID=A0AAD2FWH3_9STRA|nr:unnamed protein product [Cylindrotheca closterium]
METINAVLLMLATLISALIVHQLLKPKPKAKKVDTKAFESIIDDDGWAEEEEGEKNAVPALTTVPSPEAMPMPTAAPQDIIPDPPKKINEGPYNIGDRVVLKNLVSAQELNGRHGFIADLWDKKTERYPVDLDLMDPTRKSPLSVKVGNMEKEPVMKDTERAMAVKACLEESEARTASFIFSALRGSLQNSLKGEKDPQKLAAFGWKFWKTPDGQGVYPSLRDFLTKGILEQNKLEDLEKQLNAANPKGAYAKVSKAMTSELAVASWHIRVSGAFWIVGVGPEGTLVVPENNTRQVYSILGLKVPLGAQGQFPRPPKFFLTLLPWYGRIIHDPMIMTTTGGNQVELANPQLAVDLVTACKAATQEGRVVSRLAQLEVEGGSKEGLPYHPFNKPPPTKMDPATEKERGFVDSLADYTSAADKQPTSAWNFIRSGRDNNEVIIINGKGAKLGAFLAGGPEPTHMEILESLLVVCQEKKERPRIVGVDTPSAVTRLQFLTQGVANMTVAQVNVTRKPQQQAPSS